MERYQHALEAAEQGWAVFPLRPDDKRPPAGLAWKERSTSDAERVLRYAEKVPEANWACDLGKSGLLVVDVDCKRKTDDGYVFDRSGFDSLLRLFEGRAMPAPSSCVNTGSGGVHLWFRQGARPVPGRTAAGFMPLIDVKSAGGYALLPGCYVPPCIDHPSADGRYVCEEAPLEAQEAPSWLLEVLVPPPAAKDEDDGCDRFLALLDGGAGGARAHLRRLAGEVAATRHPGRNSALNDAAFKMRDEVRSGLVSVGEVTGALLQACAANGLIKDGERACRATIASGLGVH